MDVGNAIILGIIQGLTEFLPVSSSGHLVLGEHLLGITEQGIVFEVFVHFGTLLAVFTVFRQDLLDLAKSFFRMFGAGAREAGLKSYYENDEYFRLLIYIIIGTIPAVVIGLLFEDHIERAFNSPRIASCSGFGYYSWHITIRFDDQHRTLPEGGWGNLGAILFSAGYTGHTRRNASGILKTGKL